MGIEVFKLKDSRGRITGYKAVFGALEAEASTPALAKADLDRLAERQRVSAHSRRYVHCADGTVYAIVAAPWGGYVVDITRPGQATPCSWMGGADSLDVVMARVMNNVDANGGICGSFVQS